MALRDFVSTFHFARNAAINTIDLAESRFLDLSFEFDSGSFYSLPNAILIEKLKVYFTLSVCLFLKTTEMRNYYVVLPSDGVDRDSGGESGCWAPARRDIFVSVSLLALALCPDSV